jgi:hypothetical protein
VANDPFERAEDVHLHLGEHASIVESAAHVVEFVNLGNAVLLITILSSNQ